MHLLRRVAVVASIAGLAVLAFGVPAQADPTPTCSASCTLTVSYTGTSQNWTVPAGVTSVSAVVAGAAGGIDVYGTPAGDGGMLSTTVPLTPGHILTFVVGGRGADGSTSATGAPAAAYGGGGVGGYYGGPFSSETAGSGGGGSFVFDTTTGTLLLAAGGGGGSADGNAGGTGGSNGAGGDGAVPGFCVTGGEGHGGTESAGGASGGNVTPGTAGSGPATSPSALGVGGTGGADGYTSGGGGGGYTGGGGGGHFDNGSCGYASGGGGGAGYLTSGTSNTTTSTNSGDGSITLTWTVSTTTTLSVSPVASSTVSAPVTLTATVTPTPPGGTVTFQDATTTLGTATVDSATGQATFTTSALPVGGYSLTATYGGTNGGYAPSGPSSAVSYTITAEPTPTPSPSSPPSSSTPTPRAPATVALSATEVRQGGTLHVSGAGFSPEEAIHATLHSADIALGTHTAAADGTVHFAFTVPASLLPGRHTVTLTQNSGSVASTSFTVVASGGTTSLASTGADVGMPLLGGLALLITGTIALLAARRHHPAGRRNGSS